jgi:hypothetical protein
MRRLRFDLFHDGSKIGCALGKLLLRGNLSAKAPERIIENTHQSLAVVIVDIQHRHAADLHAAHGVLRHHPSLQRIGWVIPENVIACAGQLRTAGGRRQEDNLVRLANGGHCQRDVARDAADDHRDLLHQVGCFLCSHGRIRAVIFENDVQFLPVDPARVVDLVQCQRQAVLHVAAVRFQGSGLRDQRSYAQNRGFLLARNKDYCEDQEQGSKLPLHCLPP